MTSTLTDKQLTRLNQRAEKLGFTRPFIADLSLIGPQPGEWLKAFITQNYHGTMDWLEDTYERRRHPINLWPEAKSAVVLGLNYGPDHNPLSILEHPSKAAISVYAQNRDYHDIIKGRLKELAGLLARDTGEDVKVFVDTAPLMEKPLAQAAGLGWQGKHTNLVNREFGSWLFLGVILSAAKLAKTEPEIDHCGSCRACLDICPTQAFPAPYQLDARRCISYLTIEHDGPIDPEFRPLMGNRIYGCDDCLAVCPWNKFAQTASEAKLSAREDLKAPDLETLSRLDEQSFRKFFSGSPIKRIGRNQFIRNVLYAMGNSGDVSLSASIAEHLNSADDVVRDAANWALKQIENRNE